MESPDAVFETPSVCLVLHGTSMADLDALVAQHGEPDQLTWDAEGMFEALWF